LINNNHKNVPKPKLLVPSFVKEIITTVVFVIAVMVLFDLAVPRSIVDGQSMEPTLQSNDRLVISRISYLLQAPERGDVVVLNAVVPRDAERGIMLIKRVIGLPGEHIEIRDQQIWVNDVLLNESYIDEACTTRKCPDEIWQLGDDEFFVMGDNRNHSNDSRSFDAVPFDHIVGQAIFRYWPPTTMGIITD